jgi:protein involved in plasmid replication-relaxation
MTAARPTPVRVRTAYVDWLDHRLSLRDWSVIETVNLLRVVSGQQLERLCFANLPNAHSRTVTRSRVLKRLVRERVIVPVGRRVGGAGRGSTVQAFALDTAGRELLARRQLAEAERVRVRRPGAPGERTIRHLLAVSELYTELVELARTDGLTVDTFKAEPAAWWPNGIGGFLKPDAYAVLARSDVRDHWWIEVDLATESLPTVRAKVSAYLDFRRRGEGGPDDVLPWLLISTINAKRRAAIAQMVRRLPDATELVTVVESTEAAQKMYSVLRE